MEKRARNRQAGWHRRKIIPVPAVMSGQFLFYRRKVYVYIRISMAWILLYLKNFKNNIIIRKDIIK